MLDLPASVNSEIVLLDGHEVEVLEYKEVSYAAIFSLSKALNYSPWILRERLNELEIETRAFCVLNAKPNHWVECITCKGLEKLQKHL